MKRLSLILVVLVAVTHTIDAFTESEKIECFRQNDFDPKYLELAEKSSDPKAELFKHTTEDKFACIVACLFGPEKGKNQTVYSVMKETISKGFQFNENREELLSILESCKHEEEDCKFLQCIKIARNPFYQIMFG